MIESQRTNDIRTPGKSDDADAIVRPGFDEFAGHLADGVDPRRGVAADGEILRQHRAGNIEHDHDVDPAGFDFGQAFAELRAGQRDDENGEREIEQTAHEFSRARAAPLAQGAQGRGRGKNERGGGAALAAQPGDQRDEEKEQKEPRMREGKTPGGVTGPEIKRVQARLLSRSGSLPRAADRLSAGRRLVAREFDQIAAIQEIAQERLFVG